MELGASKDTDNAQVGPSKWTQENAAKAQEAVDHICRDASAFLNLEFSVTVADPDLGDCPLILCSAGFTTLTGHEIEEVVGRSCHFLLDPVPPEHIDDDMRRLAREFRQAVAIGKEFKTPASLQQPWMLVGMPVDRPSGEVLIMEKNARKDGTLFDCLTFMKKFSISHALDDEKSYIIGLQSELPQGLDDFKRVAENLEQLDSNLTRVTHVLSSWLTTRCSMACQLRSTPCKDPMLCDSKELTEAFTSKEIQPWEEGRFKLVRKLANRSGNRGTVMLMQDLHDDQLYAIKQIPNSWIEESHEEFLRLRPFDKDLPWVDIGCTQFLNSRKYKYACNLQGVYRNDEDTFIVSEYASGGDMFDTCGRGPPPGAKRESALAPLVVQLLSALQQLHACQIVHRDVSLENIVCSLGGDGKPQIKLIDYGTASSERYFKNCVHGKGSYQAPEMHQENTEYDAFAADVFSAGVVAFAILLKDYPWLSTKPDGCKQFLYAQAKGLPMYLQRKRFRGTTQPLAERMSQPLIQLVVGVLAPDPSSRMTLVRGDQESVWASPWIKGMSRKTQKETESSKRSPDFLEGYPA